MDYGSVLKQYKLQKKVLPHKLKVEVDGKVAASNFSYIFFGLSSLNGEEQEIFKKFKKQKIGKKKSQ